MKTSSILLVLAAISAYAGAADFQSPQHLKLGRFQSRAVWTPLKGQSNAKAPAVILVPGSGPSSPRELIPGDSTVDGKDALLFDQLASALNRGGVQTLQLGKPGVEDLASFDATKLFYDKNLYVGLHWGDLLSNLEDSIAFVRSQPNVDSKRIYILGHSEGTQLAVDIAHREAGIMGVILLGYAGEDLGTIVDWQIYRRPVEKWIAPSVDANHDGFVTRDEVSKWKEFSWDWKPGQDQVSLAEIEAAMRRNPDNTALYDKIKGTALFSDGIWNRGPLYASTASLSQDVYIFTGALDEQTPPEEALKARDACAAVHKLNCKVTIVPGVGHGFSPPRPPRSHPFLDMTVGPVTPSFQNLLTALGNRIAK